MDAESLILIPKMVFSARIHYRNRTLRESSFVIDLRASICEVSDNKIGLRQFLHDNIVYVVVVLFSVDSDGHDIVPLQ